MTSFANPGIIYLGANDCGLPEPNQVIIYQGRERRGRCAVLGVGKYPNPSAFGLRDNSISSIDVGADVRATLYEHANCGGRQAHVEGGSYYDPVGNNATNETSSIEVFPKLGGPAATFYVRNYPSDAEPFWAEGVQGIAHDDRNWFITQTTTLSKIRLTTPLANAKAVMTVGIPDEMARAGYNHFGDLDQAHGYLLVPVQGEKSEREGGGRLPPALAVFRTDDNLSFVGWDIIPSLPSDGGAWVAYRPNTDTLFFSGGDISSTQPLYEYTLGWDLLSSHVVSLVDQPPIYLYDRQHVPVEIKTMQGGVFNSSGTLLYLVNGYCDRDEGSIHIFFQDEETTYGTLQARSENGFGPFNFEHHGGVICDEEPEGIDFFDTTGRGIPHVPDSQLHVLLLRNELGDDDIYLKHYSY
jgi:hypothetical protein